MADGSFSGLIFPIASDPLDHILVTIEANMKRPEL